MPCYKMVAAAAPPQHSVRSTARLDGGDAVDGPSAKAANGVDRTSSGAGGRRPGFNPFSGTASAALFASLALCLVLICAYSYVARRRTISGTRRRFLGRVRDVDLVPGRLSRRAAGEPRVATAVAKTLSAPAVRCADSSSGPAGDCPVCLEPLRGGGVVTAAHACGHVFHAPCIEPWLDRRDSCPVCRCTVSCRRDDPANEAPIAYAGGGARHLPGTVVVVIAAETTAWAAGSEDDEMLR
ncbi:hypothetical protein QYE76_071784 [Lolium multiflorum]|uniref:RING-type E3 ubiquitin transferase n=1 Tax=Lolium multiflorum TaxID=4521 RepID=A0AAD8SLT6_LOLMU|nr:hypothetical protein QYE76_071784 [Lolium multiflorum]